MINLLAYEKPKFGSIYRNSPPKINLFYISFLASIVFPFLEARRQTRRKFDFIRTSTRILISIQCKISLKVFKQISVRRHRLINVTAVQFMQNLARELLHYFNYGAIWLHRIRILIKRSVYVYIYMCVYTHETNGSI